jgi:eukaryotic-like serine/threonine-protein kinase
MSPTSGGEPIPAIAAGTLVGGRFLIEQPHGADALGEVLLARDQKTNKPIAVRVLAPVFSDDVATFEAIRTEIRAAAKFKHRSIVGTYGIGTHGRQHFIACEWVYGTALSELLVRRQASNAPLSLRGVYNVVAHICKALTEVHASSCHGALRPSAVWITKSGRVKVGELGLSLALVNTGKWRLLEAEAQAYLAPELLAGGHATPASDVYGVGALLHVMLTGQAPRPRLVAPSSAHPDATAAIDQVVRTCLSADPAARYTSIDQVSQALLQMVAETPASDSLEFGVDMDIDVDIAVSIAPPRPGGVPQVAQAPAARRPAPIPPVAAHPLAPAPTNGGRASGAQPARATNPFAAPTPQQPAAPPAPRKPAADDEIAALTAKLTERDAPRWMAVKGGLDHGPFTARELIKLIVDGEILTEHSLLNMTSGDRKPLAEWTDFAPFVEQYKLRKAEADHASALEKSTRIERGSNAAKFVILSGSIALLLVAGGGYLMSRETAKEKAQIKFDLAAFESGQVKITGTAGILKAPPRRGGGGNARRAGGGDSTGFSSYEDAMNEAVELGDATKGGGERQLRPGDIEGVMNRKLNTLFSCVGQELRGGSRLGTVQIDLAIRGSGQVAGASVNAGSPAFKKCIAAKVRQISFPPFPAPRMGARYSFGVN